MAAGLIGSQFTIAGVQPVIAPYSVALAFGAAVVIGLFFGTYPAGRAARCARSRRCASNDRRRRTLNRARGAHTTTEVHHDEHFTLDRRTDPDDVDDGDGDDGTARGGCRVVRGGGC